MKKSISSFEKALVLGVISGMRTTAGLHYTRSLVCNSNTARLPVQFLQKKTVASGVGLLRLTELVADKLPNMPDRIAKGGPAVRAGAGALCGAAIYHADGKSAAAGAFVGALAALLSTYAFFHLRKAVCEKTKIRDSFIGAAEDALAAAGGLALVKADRPALK